MIRLSVAHAEDLQYQTILYFDDMPAALDELESPSFAVWELMLVRLHDECAGWDAIFSDGRWIEIHRGSAKFNKISYKQNFKSLISLWQNETRTAYLMCAIEPFFDADRMIKLCCDCMLFAYTDDDIRRDCVGIINKTLECCSVNISYRPSTVIINLLVALREIQRGETPSFANIVSNILQCRVVDTIQLCQFIRTQVTAPMYVKAIANHG